MMTAARWPARSDPAKSQFLRPTEIGRIRFLTYLTYVLTHARNKSVTLPTPDEFTVSNITHVG